MKVIDGMYLMVPVTARWYHIYRRDCTGSGIDKKTSNANDDSICEIDAEIEMHTEHGHEW
jgi:hypothetical protein